MATHFAFTNQKNKIKQLIIRGKNNLTGERQIYLSSKIPWYIIANMPWPFAPEGGAQWSTYISHTTHNNKIHFTAMPKMSVEKWVFDALIALLWSFKSYMVLLWLPSGNWTPSSDFPCCHNIYHQTFEWGTDSSHL